MANEDTVGPLSQVPAVADETPAAPLSSSVGMPVKMTSGGKGTLATVSPTAGTILDETSSKAILGNMQKMLDEYNDPYRNFQQDLQKMHAWTKYDKTPAFEQIQRQEEQDRTNKYNIGQSMATMQAAQNQNKILADSMNMTGATGAGGISGVSPVQAGIDALPESQKAWGAYLAKTNPAEFQKLISTYEVKKPDSLKIADAIKGMDDNPKNRAILAQIAPELFKPQITIDANGAEHKVMPDVGAVFKQAKADQTTSLAQPSISSVKAELKTATEPGISSPQGARNVPGVGIGVHNGIDMPMAAGTAVNSFTSGKVLSAGDAGDGFGKSVVIQNPDGTTTRYAHLSDINVKPGDTIDRNSPLGAAGQTGKATGPHLHVEVRDNNNQPLDAKGYLANAAKAPAQRDLTPGEKDTSVPGVEQQYKNIAVTNEAVGKVYKDLTENKTMYQDAADSAKMAIKAVDEGKGEEQHPGSTIKQGYIFAKIAAGVPVDPEELARYSRNLTIEQAKQQYVAHGAKAAMGAQYTGKEADNFAKSLTSINDPAEFVKTTFQIMQAKNEVNLAHLRFLDKYPKDLAGGERAWDASGERERIFKNTVSAFNKTPEAKSPDIAAQVTKHWGSYDTNKYNYGYENGKLYREEK